MGGDVPAAAIAVAVMAAAAVVVCAAVCGRLDARVWSAIFHALDDEEIVITKWLVWMPAHTSRKQIGVALKSDDQKLSSLDWLANMAVDELAKHAAAQRRVDRGTRQKLQAAWANAMFWRCRLGTVTYDAQNHFVDELQPDGQVKSVKYRDSIGRPSEAKPSSTSKTPRLRSQLDDAWPEYPPYDDEAFMRSIAAAPFAMSGPVVRLPMTAASEEQPEPSPPAGLPLERISSAFQCIHDAAARASARVHLGMRAQQSASRAALQRSETVTKARSSCDPAQGRSSPEDKTARHKPRRLGIHCARITSPPTAGIEPASRSNASDQAVVRRLAASLCTAAKNILRPAPSLQPTATCESNEPEETVPVPTPDRASWLAKLRESASSSRNENCKTAQQATLQPCSYSSRRALAKSCSNPGSKGISAAMKGLMFGKGSASATRNSPQRTSSQPPRSAYSCEITAVAPTAATGIAATKRCLPRNAQPPTIPRADQQLAPPGKTPRSEREHELRATE